MITQALFVVNANSKIGFGHLKRCLIIADELREKGVASTFLVYDTPATEVEKVAANHHIQEYDSKLSVFEFLQSKEKKDALLIIDTDDDFFYEKENQIALRKYVGKLMFISIRTDVTYFSDILFNQNIMSLYQQFDVQDYTATFFGPNYFIFDEKLRSITPNERTDNNTNNLLISFGSADPANNTEKILDLLAQTALQFDKIRLVIGGLNKNVERINKHPFVLKYPDKVEIHIATTKMYELMRDTDIAITAMGLTYWELILHKIPSLVISGTAREKSQIHFFCDREYAYLIGDYDDENWQKLWLNRLDNYNGVANADELYNLIDKNGTANLVKQIVGD